MNKRGTDKVLSLYWFAILIIVAGGVFAMVYVYYGAPYDIREVEADILMDRVADCLSDGGEINKEVFNEGDFDDDFLGKCHLNFRTEFDDEEYYLKVDVYDFENKDDVKSVDKGAREFAAGCDVQTDKDYNRLVKCREQSFYSLEGDTQYIIKILTAVRKASKNVKR